MDDQARRIDQFLLMRSARPYFEVQCVNSQPSTRWPALAAEFRKLRRLEGDFIHEPVFVGSFEDAFCAARRTS